jgi:NAD+ synthase (glutamine-hydrolysing)
MTRYGFIRVAAAVPKLRVGHCSYNAERTIELLADCQRSQIHLCVFPELGLTGYTCHDLFRQDALLSAALAGLDRIRKATEVDYSGLAIVGLPLVVDGRLFNTAAILQAGQILGLIPKTYLPTYKEFYDSRYFAPAPSAVSAHVEVLGQYVPFGTDLLFEAEGWPSVCIGVEICEDLWTPIPPSCLQALAGATILANLSASTEAVGKAVYRRQLVANQSGRCFAAYVYSAAGPGESTTDVVFGGHSIIAENSAILCETQRMRTDSHFVIADIDIDKLTSERISTNSFNGGFNENHRTKTFRRIEFSIADHPGDGRLHRPIDAHPFVPSQVATRNERCDEVFQIQVQGLAQRLQHIGKPPVTIGVSGGLDSTLALLVVTKAFDLLEVPRSRILGFTMPGFGTTSRTKTNAHSLMSELGITAREIDIRQMCLDQMLGLGHKPFGIALEGHDVDSLAKVLSELTQDRRHDLVFENVQARVRTSLLMNSGFVIGTGDLSELALGWCTYNADHMSMYNPNVSVPKTLVKFLVQWAAETHFEGAVRQTLLDIVGTEISPELLPIRADGQPGQSTEATIGPYELHDFFLYHFLRYGSSPDKILFMAKQAAFHNTYDEGQLKKWLTIFLTRFFNSQFKRSCLPDGPKVGSVSLSPRGDWRMPSDAVVDEWLKTLG